MNAHLGVEQFSKTVELIYDAALDTKQWGAALSSIIEISGAESAGIHFGDISKQNMDPKALFAIGFSESIKAKLLSNAHLWALQSGLPFWNLGEVRHLPDILPHEEFINGRFYKEVLAPEKQGDYAGILAVKDGTRFVPLTFGLNEGSGTFSPQNLDMLRLLSPHICKAAKISFALELQSLKVNQLEQALDSVGAGIYLVHRDGRIVFMNRVAEQQASRGVGLRVMNGRITPNNHEAAAQLLQAMATESETSTAPISIALPDENGGLLATVLRLDKGLRQNLVSAANPALFAVFVQNPEVSPLIPGEGFAKLYGLTPAELRITLAMAPGLGPQGAADILGVSITTVKSHLQHIFTKTGTNKQSDLMQLLMRSAAPVAAH